jgi:hypothetical protein
MEKGLGKKGLFPRPDYFFEFELRRPYRLACT